MEAYTDSLLWIVILGFIIAFVLAFGIGANDVANSFGTSVGSGVLTLRQACWLATVCEVSGAILIGYKVSDTMRKGILEVSMYSGHEQELMLGCLSSLLATALWLLVATFLKLPISGTHSIVGSTIGFSLVARGTQGLKWNTLITIVGSWFISPVMSGLVSTLLYWVIKKFILNAKSPLKAGLLSLPIFYGVTLFINVLSIVHDGPKLLHMDNIPTWIALASSMAVGVLVAVLVQLFIVPWQRGKILGQSKTGKPVKFTFGNDSEESSPNGSPHRAKRPISLVLDGKQLPAITETTELVSLTKTPQQNGFCDQTNKKIDITDLSSPYPINNGNYKIDPLIVQKAENLLGKMSLDNTDLTVTSLNFIDEHNQNGYIDRRTGNKSPEIMINQLNGRLAVSPIRKEPISMNEKIDESKKNDFNNVESTGSLDNMISSTLSPNSSKVPLISSNDESSNGKSVVKNVDLEDTSQLFSFLQILTATFGSFAHGGNDVSNAIGPLIALWMIYKEGSVLQQSETPFSILLFGGVGISAGLWLWGRRVIETIGNDLTKITPSTGFTIEVGAALTVLLASKVGLPISTTHCKVGSVVFVGYASAEKKRPDAEDGSVQTEAPKAVDWHLFRNIVYAWVVTVPVAAGLSAGFMYALTHIVL